MLVYVGIMVLARRWEVHDVIKDDSFILGHGNVASVVVVTNLIPRVNVVKVPVLRNLLAKVDHTLFSHKLSEYREVGRHHCILGLNPEYVILKLLDGYNPYKLVAPQTSGVNLPDSTLELDRNHIIGVGKLSGHVHYPLSDEWKNLVSLILSILKSRLECLIQSVNSLRRRSARTKSLAQQRLVNASGAADKVFSLVHSRKGLGSRVCNVKRNWVCKSGLLKDNPVPTRRDSQELFADRTALDYEWKLVPRRNVVKVLVHYRSEHRVAGLQKLGIAKVKGAVIILKRVYYLYGNLLAVMGVRNDSKAQAVAGLYVASPPSLKPCRYLRVLIPLTSLRVDRKANASLVNLN